MKKLYTDPSYRTKARRLKSRNGRPTLKSMNQKMVQLDLDHIEDLHDDDVVVLTEIRNKLYEAE